MDVQAWSSTIEPIVTALCELDPAACDSFRANASVLEVELAALDHYVREVIGSIPPDHRVLVTAHDAFGYFGRAYGLEGSGDSRDFNRESEAGLADMKPIGSDAGRWGRSPRCSSNRASLRRNVRALVEGAAAQGHQVVIGGELFSDAMGATGSWEGTYPGMIDHNASIITTALGGDVPDGGFRAWRSSRVSNERGVN